MYELLDSGEGRKLERFGDFVLDRPDPQIIWHKAHPETWDSADAKFEVGWRKNNSQMPDDWQINFLDLKLWAKLTPFKHTGIFPEQAEQWRWIRKQQAKNVLNLFGYTGIAALVAAQTGAKVTYVDASKQALTWARKNQDSSGLTNASIRWILDDVLKFMTREVKRGNKYDAVIMDPPIFGHGPDGETWQFNKSLPELMALCEQVLAPDLKYVIINAYAVSTSSITLRNVLSDLTLGKTGQIDDGELILEAASGRQLSTGIFAKWCAS